MITASSLPRAHACSWWARADIPAYTAPPVGPAAERGSRVHRLIEQIMTGDPYGDPPGDELLLALAATAWANSLSRDGAGTAVELKLVYDAATATARVVTHGGPREYGELSPTEIAGTADLIVSDRDSRLVVVDWKTGITPAEEYRDQLSFLALAASRALSHTGPIKCVVVKLWMSPSGVAVADDTVWSMDAAALGVEAIRIASLVRGVERAYPRPGSHCRYCPAAGVCPAIGTALAVAGGVTTTPGNAITTSNAASMHERIAAASVAIDAKKAELRRYVEEHGGVPLGGGKRLAIVPATRETVSKASIERACGASEVNRLRGLGALTTTHYTELKVVRDK